MMIRNSLRFAFASALFAGVIACGSGGTADDDAEGGKGGSGGSAKGGSGGSSKGGSGGSSKGGSGGSSKGGSGGSTDTAGSGGSTPSGGSGGSMPMIDLKSGLIGHWKFDEGSGPMFTDSSGNDNNGVMVEGGTASAPEVMSPGWDEGKSGKAVRLDGMDDWLRIPDSDSLDKTGINNAVSMTAWINVEKLNDLKPHNIVLQRHEGGTRLEHFAFSIYNGLPNAMVHFFYSTGPQNMPLSEWVHVGLTYDGLTLRTYMNGIEVAFADIGWPIAADETPLSIGAGINDEDVIEHVGGRIDEVRLYDRVLDPAEIAELAK